MSVCVSVCMFALECMCAYMYECICVRICVSMDVYMCVFVCVYVTHIVQMPSEAKKKILDPLNMELLDFCSCSMFYIQM